MIDEICTRCNHSHYDHIGWREGTFHSDRKNCRIIGCRCWEYTTSSLVSSISMMKLAIMIFVILIVAGVAGAAGAAGTITFQDNSDNETHFLLMIIPAVPMDASPMFVLYRSAGMVEKPRIVTIKTELLNVGDCALVLALNKSGGSPWSNKGCATAGDPNIVIPNAPSGVTQQTGGQ